MILKVIGIHPIGLGSDLKKILQFGVVNFRGKYIGATFSVPKGIIVVVTTDYIYVIDIVSKEMIDSEKKLWMYGYYVYSFGWCFCYLAAMSGNT